MHLSLLTSAPSALTRLWARSAGPERNLDATRGTAVPGRPHFPYIGLISH